MLRLVILALCAVGSYADVAAEKMVWTRYGPGACDSSLFGSVTLTTVQSTATTASVVLTFTADHIEFKSNENIQCGVTGMDTALETAVIAVNAAIGQTTAATPLCAFSSNVLTILLGVTTVANNEIGFVVNNICVIGDFSAAGDITIKTQSDTTATPNENAIGWGTAFTTMPTWDSTSTSIVNVEGTVKFTFQAGADWETTEFGVVAVRGYQFGSGCVCTLGTNAATINVCGYDFVGFKVPTATYSDAAGNVISCTKATPLAVQSVIAKGVCMSQRPLGIDDMPSHYGCGSLPAVTATSSPTASPSTAACAGGGTAAAASALWAAAPTTSPVAAVIMSFAAICGVLLI